MFFLGHQWAFQCSSGRDDPSSSWQGGLYVALGLLRLRLVSSCFCFVLSLPLFCSSLSCLVFSLPVSYLDSPLSSLLSCLVLSLLCLAPCLGFVFVPLTLSVFLAVSSSSLVFPWSCLVLCLALVFVLSCFGRLGAHLASFLVVLRVVLGILGRSWGFLGPSWRVLGAS